MLSRAPFCERVFGMFILPWGLWLLLRPLFGEVTEGVLHSEISGYAPMWAWGVFLTALGGARLLAYLWGGNRLRIALALVTVGFFWLLATAAWWAGLWDVTFPLAMFCAISSSWCFRALVRDIALGL